VKKEKIMRMIGNLLWFILGGVWMGLGWWIAGLLAYASVVGIPWGKACFVIGNFTFFPFGKEAISREELTQNEDIDVGVLGNIGNVVWFGLHSILYRKGTDRRTFLIYPIRAPAR